jgi:phospholipase D1/2
MTLLHAPKTRGSRAPERTRSPDPRRRWVTILFAVVLALALAAAWAWTPLRTTLSADRLSEWLAPHRDAWYVFPLVVVGYIILGLLLVPVLLLILVTGFVFGPWLGSAIALAGALASGAVGFELGRLLGRETLERMLGERMRRLSRSLERNGTMAVYLVRKVPVPYLLANVMIGASKVRFRDFLVGTLLGMGPIVVAICGFGYHAGQVLRDPTPSSILLAVSFLVIPLGLAWLINRRLKQRRRKES